MMFLMTSLLLEFLPTHQNFMEPTQLVITITLLLVMSNGLNKLELELSLFPMTLRRMNSDHSSPKSMAYYSQGISHDY